MGMIELEELVGKEVLSANAKVVGTIAGASVDVPNWRVPALMVTISKGNETFVNKKQKVLGTQTVAIKTESVRSITDLVTLNVELENLRNCILEDYKAATTLADMLNDRVVGKQGREIGIVVGFQVEKDKGWSIPMFEVQVDKATIQDLDIKKKMIGKTTIWLRTMDIKTVSDVVLLDIDLEGVRTFLKNKPVAKRP